MLKPALLSRAPRPPVSARGANWRSQLEPAATSATDADTSAKSSPVTLREQFISLLYLFSFYVSPLIKLKRA